jgi:hypothetical protein
MAERIIVDPDITACMREDRRVYLSHLVNSGRRVRVMNPLRAATWEGVIFGLADHPTLLMRLDDGRERTLPQHFAVEEIEPLPEPTPEPAAPGSVGMSVEQFLEVLDDVRARVAAGDSFEGHIEYLMPENPADGVAFDVRARYRVGNSMGQGGVRFVASIPDEVPDNA